MRAKTYFHDRLLARTFLQVIPRSVLPNHLTVLRMLMTPIVAWCINAREFGIGIPLFFLVAFTDALDGSMARTRDQVTEWGRTWDPIADKLLIGSVAVILLLQHFSLPLAIAILSLEALFLLGGYVRKRQGRPVSANGWGKIKMILQVCGVLLFLFALATGWTALATASYAAFGLAVLFAVASLVTHGL